VADDALMEKLKEIRELDAHVNRRQSEPLPHRETLDLFLRHSQARGLDTRSGALHLSKC
jgi:hypothetical protein